MGSAAKNGREKVSATLSPELVRQVEAYQKEEGLPTFSAALEELVSHQLLEQRARAYYSSLSEAEKSEQRTWAELATAEASKTVLRD